MIHKKAKISARLKAKNNLNSSVKLRNPRDQEIGHLTNRVNRLRLNLRILRKRKKSLTRLPGNTMTRECMTSMPIGGLLAIMSPPFMTVLMITTDMDTEVANTVDAMHTDVMHMDVMYMDVIRMDMVDTDVVLTDTVATVANSTVMKRRVTDIGAQWSTKLHLSTTPLSDPNRFITKSTNSTLCLCQLMSETLRSNMRPLKL